MNNDLTGQEIREFVWGARSLAELNLGLLAQEKWYEMHRGTDRERDAFFDSGTGLNIRKKYLEEIENSGIDSAIILASDEAKSNAQMSIWLDESTVERSIRPQERDEIQREWDEQSETIERKMNTLAIKIKEFIKMD